jgi:hypothetical protein
LNIHIFLIYVPRYFAQLNNLCPFVEDTYLLIVADTYLSFVAVTYRSFVADTYLLFQK